MNLCDLSDEAIRLKTDLNVHNTRTQQQRVTYNI